MKKSKSIEICSSDLKEIYNTAINFSLYEYITPSLFKRPNLEVNEIENKVYNQLKEFNQQNSIYNYLMVSTISIMESYLHNIIVEEIKKNKSASIKFVENYNFSRNLSPKDVIDGPENLSLKTLDNIIYHNLKKVNPIFKIVFNLDILKIEKTDIGEIFKFIEIRHKIVHDSGKVNDKRFYLSQYLFISSFTKIYDWLLNIDSLIINNQIRKRKSIFKTKFYNELSKYSNTPILETGSRQLINDAFEKMDFLK